MKGLLKTTMSNSKQKPKKSNKVKKHPIQNFITNVIYYIFKPPVILILMLVHHVRYKKHGYKIPKGPVLFLSNHMSNWDGVYMMGFTYRKHIHFVVNEELFANKFYRFFTSYLLQFIKRSSTLTDLSHVREMKRFVKEGRSVGIYPEGDIGMFGDGLPVDESIAKLAKLLHVPVVTTKITGANLRAPRPIKKTRRSKITYHITDVISLEDVKSSDVATLHNRIYEGIHHDEREWQKEAMVKLGRRRKLAEHLEQGLFLCPKCGEYQTLSSKNNTVACSHCGFSFNVNRYEQYVYANDVTEDVPYFINGADYDHWQLEQLYKRIDEWDDPNTPIFTRSDLVWQSVNRNDIFQPYSNKNAKPCSIALYFDRLELSNEDGEVFQVIKFDNRVERCLVQYKAVYEIDFENTRLRVYSRKTDFPAHLFIQASRHILAKNNVILSLY